MTRMQAKRRRTSAEVEVIPILGQSRGSGSTMRLAAYGKPAEPSAIQPLDKVTTSFVGSPRLTVLAFTRGRMTAEDA